MSQNNWDRIFEYTDHKNSVNTVSFCPHEYGLILLCGSSDGYISLHEYKSKKYFKLDENWISKKFEAHPQGVTSVSWGPAINPITFDKEENTNSNNQLAPMRFVTGGCDKLIKIWKFSSHLSNLEKIEEKNPAISIEKLDEHKDWVRDVCWMKYVGYAYDTIATCSEDQTVIIWKFSDKKWESKCCTKKFDYPLWKLSWSHCGSYLAVSGGDNIVTIFSENVDGSYEEISNINPDSNVDQINNQ